MEESPFKKLTGGQLLDFRKKLWEDENLYSVYCFKNIAHLFLKEFLGNDIFKKFTFEQIRSKYVDLLDSDIPEGEEKFFAYICKNYIHLETEPRICLLELYKKSLDDLREIEERISKYQKELESINRPNNDNQNDDYMKQIIKHYIDLNTEAKNEIIKFITSEEIKSCALEKASIKFLISGVQLPFESYTYSYEYQRSRYDKEKLSEIANKFLCVNPSKMREIENLYKNRSSEFYEYAQKYITDKKIIEKIRQDIKENHFLYARKEVLEPALDAYPTNKVLFLNLVPLQIEGIFYDYCLGLGIPEESLRKASLGEKLDKIISVNPNLYDFEYFKFIFPKTRNIVAHGKFFYEEKVNQISCLIILDLYDTCSRIKSEDIPVNLLVNILKEIKENRDINSNLLKISYANFLGIKCPEFYGLKDTIDLVNQKCSENDFLDYVYEIISRSPNEPALIKCIEKILKYYKDNHIQIYNRTELFHEIQQIKSIYPRDELSFREFCQAL